jgi:hypothetical protein
VTGVQTCALPISLMAAVSDAFGRVLAAGRGDEALAALADLDLSRLSP